MSTPEADPADLAEQGRSADPDDVVAAEPTAQDVPAETDPADAAEQAAPLMPADDSGEDAQAARGVPLEADEGDVAEQLAPLTGEADEQP